jgi:hypothetical protein
MIEVEAIGAVRNDTTRHLANDSLDSARVPPADGGVAWKPEILDRLERAAEKLSSNSVVHQVIVENKRAAAAGDFAAQSRLSMMETALAVSALNERTHMITKLADVSMSTVSELKRQGG